jgi:hypothetical protein
MEPDDRSAFTPSPASSTRLDPVAGQAPAVRSAAPEAPPTGHVPASTRDCAGPSAMGATVPSLSLEDTQLWFG